jgi:hypothetical protein
MQTKADPGGLLGRPAQLQAAFILRQAAGDAMAGEVRYKAEISGARFYISDKTCAG